MCSYPHTTTSPTHVPQPRWFAHTKQPATYFCLRNHPPPPLLSCAGRVVQVCVVQAWRAGNGVRVWSIQLHAEHVPELRAYRTIGVSVHPHMCYHGQVVFNLLKSFNNSDKNKSLAELGCGPGREPASFTRMDSDDWKMQRRNPSRTGKPMDCILVRSEFIVWKGEDD